MYTIRFTDDALEEFEGIRAHDRNRILDEIASQLAYEPALVTRRKKVLQGIEPPWEHVGPVWQLRIGDYRVFYDLFEDERAVWIRALRWKGPRTTEEILSPEDSL